METDAVEATTTKGPQRAASKKPMSVVEDISSDEGQDEYNFDSEVSVAAEAGKKGRSRGANSKASKQAAITKKRGPSIKQSQLPRQKLITESFKSAENMDISPEKKVRRMRPSPFNKKSGSVLNRGKEGQAASAESTEDRESASALDSIDEVSEVVPARPRPQRANRKQTMYVLSDSESDESEQPSEDFSDSEFDEDDD